MMAGYIAAVEDWMRLSDEWADLLRLRSPYRTITEFKQSAMRDSPLALEQSELFYRVIEKHVSRYVTCSVRITDLQEVHSQIQWPQWLDNVSVFANEYFTGFDAIVRGLARHQEQLGIDEPVDFIFDNHSSQTRCLEGWSILKRMAPPLIKPWLGDTPSFKDSVLTKPLQAADMLAYWVRDSQAVASIESDNYHLTFPWRRRAKMKGINIYFTKEMISKNFRDAILAISLLRYGVPQRVVQQIVTPDPQLPKD